jgi:integrase
MPTIDDLNRLWLDPPALPEGKDREFYWSEELPGFGVSLFRSGRKVFLIQYRPLTGKSKRMTLECQIPYRAETEARKELDLIAQAKREGRNYDPAAKRQERKSATIAKLRTFKSVSEEYMKQEGSKLRIATARQAMLAKQILPVLGKLPLENIKRSTIIRLCDDLESERSPHAARKAFDCIRKILNWYAARSDDYSSPIVPNMRQVVPSRGTRIFTEGELRELWNACGDESVKTFGAVIRLCILCCARRDEIRCLRAREIDLKTGVIIIPAERCKTKLPHAIPLSPLALQILNEFQPFGDYVFQNEHRRSPVAYAHNKIRLDHLCNIPKWRIGDCRRTSRSMLSPLVDTNIAERIQGHVIGGSRRHYDLYQYLPEKREGLCKLADLVMRIVGWGDPLHQYYEAVRENMRQSKM